MARLRRIAYGKSSKKTGIKPLDSATNFGVRVWQSVHVRAPLKAYKRGKR